MAKTHGEIDYARKFGLVLAGFGADLQMHEDAYVRYVPDMSYALAGKDGWIEFKYLDKGPAYLDAIDHYTRGQEIWLQERGRAGSGLCFLVVGIAGDADKGGNRIDQHFIFHWSRLKDCRKTPWLELKPSMVDRFDHIAEAVKFIVDLTTGRRPLPAQRF